jgi:alkaline phosphatase D
MVKLIPLAVALLLTANSIAADSPTITTIAFGSCSRQDQPQPILDLVSARNPDLFIYLGDNIYGDTFDMDVLRAKYQMLADKPEFQRLKKSTQIIATWDDHDYGADDSGRRYRRKEESKEIFLEFFEEPEDSPRRKHDGIYTSYTFGPKGKRVQVILLDLRTFRSDIDRSKTPPEREHAGPYAPTTGRDVTLMGNQQWKWLKKQLKQPADVRIIGSSVQFAAEFHGWESWANFPDERKRFIDLIDKTHANGVILLSGDMHYGELSRMTTDVPYPLYDFTSSGINLEWKHPMENIHRMGETEFRSHIGWIEIDWDQPDPEINLRLQVVNGEFSTEHQILLSELSK